MQKLLAFVNELDRRRIHRRLAGVREAVMVEVDVPGARWEVEFFADGHVEVEVFKSAGCLLSHAEAESALQQLLDEDDQAEGNAVQQPPWNGPGSHFRRADLVSGGNYSHHPDGPYAARHRPPYKISEMVRHERRRTGRCRRSDPFESCGSQEVGGA